MNAVRAKSAQLGTQGEPAAATSRAAHVPSFALVYAEHAGFLFRVLRGMGVAQASVEDAAQDVFMVVHRRLPAFDGRHKLRTWLFEIAYRIACEHRRKQQRSRAPAAYVEQLQDAGGDPAEALAERDRQEAVGRVLDKLDDQKRVVLVLADMEELSVPEIAELTNTPVSTVYTRLRRARLEFSSAWASAQRRSP